LYNVKNSNLSGRKLYQLSGSAFETMLNSYNLQSLFTAFNTLLWLSVCVKIPDFVCCNIFYRDYIFVWKSNYTLYKYWYVLWSSDSQLWL